MSVIGPRILSVTVALLGIAVAVTASADKIKGTDGNDVLFGTPDDDRIIGQAGDDFLWGAPGDDMLIGGPGDDLIRGLSGDDEAIGGDGDDTIQTIIALMLSYPMRIAPRGGQRA